MKLLLTGFEPFGGESINPSAAIVQRLAGATIPGVTLHTLVLPVVLATAPEILAAQMAEIRPDAVIMLGEAGGRAAITPERIAVNFIHARIPDNAGHQPIEAPSRAGAPAAYFSTLPVSAIVAAVRANVIPAEASMTAGAYVCNHLFFQARHWAEAHAPAMPVGFIHVPYAPEQTVARPGIPSMSLDMATEAIRIVIETMRNSATVA